MKKQEKEQNSISKSKRRKILLVVKKSLNCVKNRIYKVY